MIRRIGHVHITGRVVERNRPRFRRQRIRVRDRATFGVCRTTRAPSKTRVRSAKAGEADRARNARRDSSAARADRRRPRARTRAGAPLPGTRGTAPPRACGRGSVPRSLAIGCEGFNSVSCRADVVGAGAGVWPGRVLAAGLSRRGVIGLFASTAGRGCRRRAAGGRVGCARRSRKAVAGAG